MVVLEFEKLLSQTSDSDPLFLEVFKGILFYMRCLLEISAESDLINFIDLRGPIQSLFRKTSS